MIEVKNLKKSFDGQTILQNVNFTVNKGDSVVIIGGSGCGKSTLLRCLNRLIVPDEGEILFEGKNILDKKTDVDLFRRKVGMVYQQFNLFEHLNVMENMILAPMKVLKMSEKDATERAEELLKKVGMENRRYRMPSALSGGQKQRVAIARTLMMQPECILFDEPTSALDPTMVDEVESVIRRLVDDGMTSVIVTHEMRFAEKISSNILFLAEKGIYEEGPAEQIFHNPKRELTRQFVYRSRMFNRKVTRRDVDLLSLNSELKSFAMPYGLNRKQTLGISYILEEILMPILQIEEVNDASVSLICDESGSGHKLIIECEGYKADTELAPEFDDMGRLLARNFTQSIDYYVNATGNWEVTYVL